MSTSAKKLNQQYIKTMQDAGVDTVYGRVRDMWWPHYTAMVEERGFTVPINHLDHFMTVSRTALRERAERYSEEKGHPLGSAKYMQGVSQFLKSNTGKMFERFVGLAIAHVLIEQDADFCIAPFKTEHLRHLHGLTRENFEVHVNLLTDEQSCPVDADLLVFNPSDPDEEFFMVSIKSTLKDRFHNVPFWNLLRRCAISEDFPDITASDPTTLAKARYIAICTDLAEEQPDFASEVGPRNLLRLDAALLDGAYITASGARGIVLAETFALGHERNHAFGWLSEFVERLLCSSENSAADGTC
ncbi:MAG: hypothetical protein JWN41_404 [Thermoleophilia bacterium]|nr:hypothetical protein [Thermoleophilia bacterium]